MELNEYKNLKNRRYSPKEVLGYLIVSSNNVVEKNMDNLQNSFESELLKNIHNKEVIGHLSDELLKKITNYWSLTVNQVIAYSKMLFSSIVIRSSIYSEKINLYSQKRIANDFVYFMKQYSPNEVEEFCKSGILRKNIKDGGTFYSPRQVVSSLISCSNNAIDKSLYKLMDTFENELVSNKNKETLIRIDEKFKDKIKNNWNITLNQAISYSYIVFHLLLFEKKGFSSEDIIDIFIYVMRLYSPDNAEEFVNQKNMNN